MVRIWNRIQSIFREGTGDKPPTYLEELDKHCARFVFVLSILAVVIWLRYIPIDKQFYPDMPWMTYLRYGLIFTGLFCLSSMLVVRFRFQGIIMMSILSAYYIVAAAVLAGATNGRSIYFAGYIVSILVVLFTPLPRIINYLVTFSSIIAFGIFAWMSKIDLKDQETAFMVSLCVNVILLSSVFIYILDRSRKRSYQKSKEIENRIREIENQKREIQTLNDFAKALNEEQDIDMVLEKVFSYIQKTYDIDYIWLNIISEDKKRIENYKFFSEVQLTPESIDFMNSFSVPLETSSGTFYLTYKRRKSFYLNRNIEDFLVSDVDKKIASALKLDGFLIIPLMIKNEVIALISFTKYKSSILLNSEQRKELERFCEQVAGALNTAKILKDLSRSLQNLKESQEQLIHSEKMAGLGQIIANVAHEINSPLGAIKASADNLKYSWVKFLTGITAQLQKIPGYDSGTLLSLNHLLKDQNREFTSTKEARQLKKDMIQDLKSRSIPETRSLEIADSLIEVGIYQVTDELMQLIEHPSGKEFLDFVALSRGISHKNENILTATDRTARIVTALKTFSHRDSHGAKTEYNLVKGIQTVLTIYGSLLKRGIELEEQYDDIPSFYAFGDELNQVWTNLLHNAMHAIESNGKIGIIAKIAQEDGKRILSVTVSDSGKGIPVAIQGKIFDPFFTTKAAGEGSGLGLHITTQIVEKHNGRLELESRPGYTEFRVFLPLEEVIVLT
jgi:signal transduction histidine kinase